jgi:hypothetical protein
MTLSSRVEVYTQLSCSRLHHNYNTSTLLEAPFHYDSPQPASITLIFDEPGDGDGKGEEHPGQLPSPQCLSDPAVQAGAGKFIRVSLGFRHLKALQTARIQTMFTITMGLLSALTTGWWGHFGERHGRTKVLAICSFGWFLTVSKVTATASS